MTAVRVAVIPEHGMHKLAGHHEELRAAVVAGGGVVTDVADAEALVWCANNNPDELREVLPANPQLRWVQLPSAGVEAFLDVIDEDRAWTCAKGVYAQPVAEHALALALGGMRGLSRYVRADTWSPPYGINLVDARVTILGGGEITRTLLGLLTPFDVTTTVVRNRPQPLDGADDVVGPDQLHAALSDADLVVLALALTPDTRGIIDAAALDVMPDHAWLVNVARGQHVVTDDLVTALRDHTIGGAALDVTDPEPLPDGHPLWDLDNVIITPHVGNTPEMGLALLTKRITDNVARYRQGHQLLGPVHTHLGY